MPDLLTTLTQFVAGCRQPALFEPGEEVLALAPRNYEIEVRSGRVFLQAWDDKRNVVRRVSAIRSQARGRMELAVELFGRREGRLFVVDLARPTTHDWERRGTRMVFRERFRQMLGREYASWTLAELSTEPDLHHSLSPAYPRAFLRRGQSGLAAIAAGPESSDPSGALTFGLIWLDYLRKREKRLAVEGLAIFLPIGGERNTCHRVRYLHPGKARYDLFAYSAEDRTVRLDVNDYGNTGTRVETCREPVDVPDSLLETIADVTGAESVAQGDGSVSLRVRGLEFARVRAEGASYGIDSRSRLHADRYREMASLARELARMRSPAAPDQRNHLYRINPESWLEASVRARLDKVHAGLRQPVYGQVPAFAGGERGVLDMLAADHQGRLTVIELKATPDVHLPLQALDYWLRVKWHLDRDEFTGRGYFPGMTLRRDAPRLLLVSPALEFHPTSEILLGYFAPVVDVERVGLGVEWRTEVNVLFRLKGPESPHPSLPCH